MAKEKCKHCGALINVRDIRCKYCETFTERFKKAVNKRIEIEEKYLFPRILGLILLAGLTVICYVLIDNFFNGSKKTVASVSFYLVSFFTILVWAIWFISGLINIIISCSIVKKLKNEKLNNNDFNYLNYQSETIIYQLQFFMEYEYNMEQYPNIPKRKKEKAYKRHPFLAIIIVLTLSIITGILLPPISESYCEKAERPSVFTLNTKKAPEVTATTSLSGVEVVIITDEYDYEEIHVLVNLSYEKGVLKETLIAKNVKKESIRVLRLSLPLTDSLKYKNLNCEIGYYK